METKILPGVFTIPEELEAEIKDGKIIVRKKESEDERNWKAVMEYVKDDALRDWLEKKIERKPAEWSEKDEKDIQEAADYLRDYANNCVQGGNSKLYLQSLADRIESIRPQPKQEWSEEDERIRQCLIEDQEEALNEVANSKCGHSEIISDKKEMYRERIAWLKSLRPQPNNNLRWRRATEGENLPESIILPDGEEPRFGKCAVKDSYYIPVEELKELPKE